MSYNVIMVSDRRMINDFLRLPFQIYQDDPFWVPPISSEVRRVLHEKHNPYFGSARLNLFICYKETKAVARTAIVIDPGTGKNVASSLRSLVSSRALTIRMQPLLFLEKLKIIAGKKILNSWRGLSVPIIIQNWDCN